MSQKLPLVSCNDLVKFLKKEGFVELRQSGSHKFLKDSKGRVTIVPIHNNKDLGRGLLKAILEEINMSREEFLSKYKKNSNLFQKGYRKSLLNLLLCHFSLQREKRVNLLVSIWPTKEGF
ncbi:MAG: type II toxin-antitoxin system HicA family toxin [Nanoarchaeota archaeon]